MSDHLSHAPEFMELAGVLEEDAKAILRRLKKAAKEYGDASYDRTVAELLGEIELEMQDLVGWPFIIWRKMQTLPVAERTPQTKQAAEALSRAMVTVAADAAIMLDHLRDLKRSFA